MIQPGKKEDYPIETDATALIRFQDCDPLGHLNNAKYFDYFFNAREDQVSKIYGYSPGEFYKEFGCAWVVYNHNISYISSVVFGERVRVMSRVIHYNENSAVVEYYMTDEHKKELKCLMWTTLKYIDVKTGKTAVHQPVVTSFMEIMKLDGVDYPNLSIKERIRQLKLELSE